MKVLVIGQGAREHALCWKLRQSSQVTQLWCAPGNPGIGTVAKNVPVQAGDIEGLVSFAETQGVDLTVVGPELPLSLGVVDAFRAKGLRIFGPSKAAAELESSKIFAKNIMEQAGVRTAKARTFDSKQALSDHVESAELPFVLKADGLASGKGVVVCHSRDDVAEGIEQLCDSLKASTIIVEEFLTGREASFIVATDGSRVVPLATSHDYKRLKERDQGPNTGGMGSVSPTPVLNEGLIARAVKEVVEPVLKTMRDRGTPFSGFLYAGLMVRGEEMAVLEFNARLGDPETQSILRRMDSDLFELLFALSDVSGSPSTLSPVEWTSQTAVCLVLASPGYPHAPELGDQIHGVELASDRPGVVVFHAGTTQDSSDVRPTDRHLRTSGGRVLSVTSMAASLEEASRVAYQAADLIQFRGRQVRRDIGEDIGTAGES